MSGARAIVNDTSQVNTHDTLRAWIVCLSASLYFFFEFIQLNMFNAISPALLGTFSINAEQLGNVSAYYFYADVLMLLPAGMILDRLPTKRLIQIAMTVTTASIFLISFATQLWMIEMGRFFTGLAAAFCFLSCIRLASRWFPTYKLALVVGVIVTMAMMGGMIAQTPLTYLTDQFGWRHALRFDALLGIGILLVISLCVRNFPPDQCNDSHASNNKLKSDGFWRVLKTTLMNKQNWLGGIYTSLLNLPIFILGGTWGSLYLMQAHGFSHQSSSYIDSMIFVGTIIGSPLVGWISDKLGRRKTPMMVCSILSILVIFALMIAPYQLPLTVFMLLFFALGLFTSAQVISYPLIAESNPIEITATAESIASVLIMSGGMMVPVFGWLMGLHWHHTYLNHAPFYSTGDYRLAMSILPVAFLLSLITSFLIRETYGVRACLKSAKL